ncbi:MAG: N-acetylmuramoyl-L-alanine amidase [Candidatus Omnitrophota bacterium]|jgi:LysM repeat protein
MLINKIIKLSVIIAGLMLLSSCATVSTLPATPPISTSPSAFPPPPPVIRHDIVHIVAPGETLWRISKTYDVPISDIMQVNKLRNANELCMGQRILVPKAMPARPVVTLYPSQKWKYIIIHHSATDVGSALEFHFAHERRGFARGLGYHFVIDNGSVGKSDGHIEVSPRWIKQQDGAHCKAGRMNSKGIGICLVGDFTGEYVSEKQLSSLVYLVNLLRKYYNIPLGNIMGHGQVRGANTQCPGKKFPWNRFFNELRAAGN